MLIISHKTVKLLPKKERERKGENLHDFHDQDKAKSYSSDTKSIIHKGKADKQNFMKAKN